MSEHPVDEQHPNTATGQAQTVGQEETVGPEGAVAPEDAAAPGRDGRPELAAHTGNADVDRVVQAIADVADAPLAEQLPVYQAAHRTLQETLTAIDGQ